MSYLDAYCGWSARLASPLLVLQVPDKAQAPLKDKALVPLKDKTLGQWVLWNFRDSGTLRLTLSVTWR